MGEQAEEADEKLPPCLRVCGREHKLRAMSMMSVSCDLLKRMGACKADEFCKSEGVRRPVAYYKTKFTARFRRGDGNEDEGRE